MFTTVYEKLKKLLSLRRGRRKSTKKGPKYSPQVVTRYDLLKEHYHRE